MATPAFAHVNTPRGAVQSLNFYWNVALLEWVPGTQPGGGSGGGLTDTELRAAPVVVEGSVTGVPIPVTGTVTTVASAPTTSLTSVTQVADTASSTTIKGSNISRVGLTVENDSSAVLYLKCGTTASLTDYTVRLVQYAYWECPFGYTGNIDGIWATDPGDGGAKVTEFYT